MASPPPDRSLRAISSMATRAVLADLAAAFEAKAGVRVAIESVGGVDAARRVAAGEAVDVVLLASDAIDALAAAGHLAAGSRVDVARSQVAVAVRAGAARPEIGDEAALKAAVLGARSLGHSTGPSGLFLLRLFERWGIAEAVAARTVQARPGVPVGSLLAGGEIDLAFQQLSELQNLPGVEVLGVLPPPVACITVFSAGVPTALAAGGETARTVAEWLAFLSDDDTAAIKRRHGMEPARAGATHRRAETT